MLSLFRIQLDDNSDPSLSDEEIAVHVGDFVIVKVSLAQILCYISCDASFVLINRWIAVWYLAKIIVFVFTYTTFGASIN